MTRNFILTISKTLKTQSRKDVRVKNYFERRDDFTPASADVQCESRVQTLFLTADQRVD